jgi:hypothetical protein
MPRSWAAGGEPYGEPDGEWDEWGAGSWPYLDGWAYVRVQQGRIRAALMPAHREP